MLTRSVAHMFMRSLALKWRLHKALAPRQLH
jgi:hypothetical protein